MKKQASRHGYIAAIIISSALAFNALAHTNDNFALHKPNDCDKLHPNVAYSQSAIGDVDAENRIVEFNAALFSPSDDADAAVYISNDTLSYIQFATNYRFKIESDTLKYIGYENRAGEFSLDVPAHAFIAGAGSVGSAASKWKGTHLHYGKQFLKHAEGESATASESGWKLVGDNDTIKDATYVKWRFTLAYTERDSIGKDMPDSIANEYVSDFKVSIDRVMTESLLTEREMWFSDAARYPILQRHRVYRLKDNDNEACDTTLISQFSMYYPAAFQYSDTGEEPFKEKPRNIADNNGSDGKIYGVDVSEASAEGERISVTLSSQTGDTDLTLTLYTDSGIRLSTPTTVKAGAVPQKHTLPIPSGAKGVIILLIESDTGTQSQKIII
ncbi:MAG: hypothetical protein Q4C37_08145 [Bacteroidales bacterium]|nr:hypothetical protein [Bacteroidales bacterium]